MAISVDTQNDLIRLVVVMFDAAVGDTYLVDLVHAAESGATLEQIAENIFTTDQAKALYPVSQSDEQFTEQFLQQLCGDHLEGAEYQMAFTEFMKLLDTGLSKGHAVVEAMNYLRYNAPQTSNWNNLSAEQENKFEVSKYHTIDNKLGATAVPDLQAVLSGVTHTDESVQKAKEAIDSSVMPQIMKSTAPGEIFALTTDADVINEFSMGMDINSTGQIPDESAGIIGTSEILLTGTLTDISFASQFGVELAP